MNRPSGVTEADIERWTKDAVGDGVPDFLRERCYFPGAWLGEQLKAAGCPEDEARDRCFAAGQRMFTASDSWAVAVACLDVYHQGIADHPGRALGESLLDGYVERNGDAP
jgi:hypothetical protein